MTPKTGDRLHGVDQPAAHEDSDDCADLPGLLHELRVHQVELHSQNEELRTAHAEAEEARDRYLELFDHAPVAYLALGRDSAVFEANIAAHALLGVSPHQLVGATLSSFVTDAYVHPFTLHVRDVFAGNEKQAVALTLATPAGRELPVLLEAIAMRGDSSRDQIHVALIDLTAVQQSEEKLRADSHFIARLIDTAQAIILVLDAEGRVVQFNPFMAKLSGYDLDEVRGKNWFEVFLPGDEQARIASLFESSLRGAEVRDNVNAILTKDGEQRVIQWSGSPLKDATGTIVGVLSVGLDITERRQREREVLIEKERNRAILDTARDAIITIDDHGIIDSFNPGAARMFGYSRDEAIGENVSMLMPRPHSEHHDNYIADYLRTGKGLIVGVGRDAEGRRNDGTVFPIHVSLAEFRVGERRSFCGIVRDLTEMRRAQEQLRQAQKMEAIGTLASGVAHDFNNLLMGVGACADVALDIMDPASAARMYLEEIRASAESGAAITQQLLAFSRKGERVRAVFELDSVVAATESMLRRLLGADIELVVQRGAADSRINADVGQIEQVLINLAINARDAMPGGGRLTIQTAMAGEHADNPSQSSGHDTRAHGPGPFVALRVSDDGGGMTPETRERLFEPFFTTKEPGKGTGLGLSMVYTIVQQNGGHITVDTQLGRGTSFEILLPRSHERPPRESAPAPDSADATSVRGETILVLEDDPTVRLGVRHYLEGAGYRVLEAGSGPEAIACCEASFGRIDLLLADMVLPGVSGEQVARRVAALDPAIKILRMSAHDTEWLVRAGRIEHGVQTLHKPFGKDELLRRVRDTLDEADSAKQAGGGRTATPKASLGTVLVAEDDQCVRAPLCVSLRRMGYSVIEAADGGEAIQLGHRHGESIDALVVDAVLPKRMGVSVARELRAHIPDLIVIYMSGYPKEIALQEDVTGPGCLFVQKPVRADQLHEMLHRARPRDAARP